MKRRCEIRKVLVKVFFIAAATQLFTTIGIALGRDDPPPSPVRPWAPPTLPKYEGELRQYQPTDAGRRYLPAIDPRKTYNLAELIDIAQRSNPETRVAWERARMEAAAVGLTESAYYPYIDWSGIHTAFITCTFIALESTEATLYKGTLPFVGCVIGGALALFSIVFLMPHMETIASLVVLVACASAIAGWVAAGSERVSYAGSKSHSLSFTASFKDTRPTPISITSAIASLEFSSVSSSLDSSSNTSGLSDLGSRRERWRKLAEIEDFMLTRTLTRHPTTNYSPARSSGIALEYCN